MDTLERARMDIDEIDKKMAALFEARMDTAREIAAYKRRVGMEIFDPYREKTVLEKGMKRLENPEYSEYYLEFMKAVMDISKEYQNDLIKGEKI